MPRISDRVFALHSSCWNFKSWRRVALSVAVPLLAFAANACGALLSEEPREEEIFDAPIEGLSQAQMATFFKGDEEFGRMFSPQEGLGPVFNQPSCLACHPNEGRGHPSTNLIRFGRGDGSDAATFDYLRELGGPQLQDHSIPGYPAERLPKDVARSARSGPIVVGLGLIEAISAETILSHADPEDRDGDGISGRPNYLPVPAFIDHDPACECIGCKASTTGCEILGRFGRKATAVDLHHQTVVAYLNDMGLTSDAFVEDIFNPLVGRLSGDRVADPEISSDTVNNVVFYLRTLRPPLRRNSEDEEVKQGEKVFADIGCASCHLPSMRSAKSDIDVLSEQQVHLYSDLLLHDMGPELADGFPEGRASGREWRTTPLWGIGIVAGQLGGNAFYLHDGRATTLDEAVTLHGGEAGESRRIYQDLSEESRSALLAFLESL